MLPGALPTLCRCRESRARRASRAPGARNGLPRRNRVPAARRAPGSGAQTCPPRPRSAEASTDSESRRDAWASVPAMPYARKGSRDVLRIGTACAGVRIVRNGTAVLPLCSCSTGPEAIAVLRHRMDQHIEIQFGQRLAHVTAVRAILRVVELERQFRRLAMPFTTAPRPRRTRDDCSETMAFQVLLMRCVPCADLTRAGGGGSRACPRGRDGNDGVTTSQLARAPRDGGERSGGACASQAHVSIQRGSRTSPQLALGSSTPSMRARCSRWLREPH